MKYSKSWTETVQEVRDISEDAKMGKQSDDQLKKLYKTASDKDQSSPANKSFTQRVAKEMKKRGISEQEGVRKVDFVDGVTPDIIDEAGTGDFPVPKEKVDIKSAEHSQDLGKHIFVVVKRESKGAGKQDPFLMLVVDKSGKPVKSWGSHPSLEGAKKFGRKLDNFGMKEEKVDENPVIAGIAAKAAQEKLKKKKKKPELKNEETLEEHCGECEESIEEKMDGRKKNSGKQAKKDNEDRRAAQRKKLGILGPNEETINEGDYELYHKTFSAAMQAAYTHAKKKGFTVDPKEIDDKVATGPKKPSSGKTNRYILGTDKKKNLHVQVANLDNKKYELNCYIEETEKENMDINETIRQVMEGKKKWQKTGLKNAEKDPVASKGDNWQKTGLKNEAKKMKKGKPSQKEIDKNTDAEDDYRMAKLRPSKYKIHKEDSDKSEPGTQGDDKEYQKKRDAILKKYGVESCAQCKSEEEKKACFNELDKAHVGDHEEEVQRESENEKKDTTYGVKKKSKEPQEEGWGAGKVKRKTKKEDITLLDKVKNLMKEKKSKKY